MANTFNVATWIALESLDILESKRSVSQFANTTYGSEFKLKWPVGDTIRVPYPDQGSIRNGLTYNPSALQARYATVEVFDPFGSDFEFDAIEAALQTPKGRAAFSKTYLEPRMAKLQTEIDSRFALWAYQQAANVVGSLGTNPTTFDASSAAARQLMQEGGCPDSGDRGFFVPPAVMRSIKGANGSLFNPVADISKMYRTGLVANADNFDWYESMSLHRHTAGTWASAVTVTTAPANGASTLSLTCTTGDTFKRGDKFSIASVLPVHPMTKRTYGTTDKTFTVTAAATGASSAATVSISPAIYFSGPHQNVDSQPAASAALTLWPGTVSPNGKSGMVGVALHSDAFALVGIELEEPTASEVTMFSQKRDPVSGVSISFIRQFDGRARKHINRFDVCLGFGTFYNDACAVAIACG